MAAGRPQLVAFLRAINVGGHTVTMARLRELFEALGFGGAATFIASGNVIFTSAMPDRARLEARIARHLHQALGYKVHTFLRTGAEVAAIGAHPAFPPREVAGAASYNVGFLAEPLAAPARRALMALESPVDRFHVHGREVYWLCRKKQSESEFSNQVFEKTVGVRATFRGLRTVTRLTAKHGFAAA